MWLNCKHIGQVIKHGSSVNIWLKWENGSSASMWLKVIDHRVTANRHEGFHIKCVVIDLYSAQCGPMGQHPDARPVDTPDHRT